MLALEVSSIKESGLVTSFPREEKTHPFQDEGNTIDIDIGQQLGPGIAVGTEEGMFPEESIKNPAGPSKSTTKCPEFKKMAPQRIAEGSCPGWCGSMD